MDNLAAKSGLSDKPLEIRQTPLRPQDIPIGVEVPSGTYPEWEPSGASVVEAPVALAAPGFAWFRVEDKATQFYTILFYRTSAGWVRWS